MSGNGTQEWIQIARARMAAKGKVKPSTKAGAVRALWPAIQAALENGQTLKTVRDWLEEEGVYLTYNQFTSYVGRMRRKAAKRSIAAAPGAERMALDYEEGVSDGPRNQAAPLVKQPDANARLEVDPLANVRAREQKRPTFEYNPDFKEDELI